MTEASDCAPSVRRTMRLGAIFDDNPIMLASN